MSIDLSIRFSHPDAVSQMVRYARIDGIVNPTWINVQPNPVTSPATIATDVPAGQYQVGATPVYADGRTCDEQIIYTDACAGLIAIHASITGNVIVVTYTAPPSAPKVRITVNYPNGGSTVANYVNNGNPISIGIPAITGDFTVSGQTVCDEGSGFYSPPSSIVTVTNTVDNVTLTSSAVGITITNIVGISGFTLPANLNVGDRITGMHGAFFAIITFTFTGTPLFNSSATLYINNVAVQCKNIPNSSGGSVGFNSASVAATDLLAIAFNTGTCP